MSSVFTSIREAAKLGAVSGLPMRLLSTPAWWLESFAAWCSASCPAGSGWTLYWRFVLTWISASAQRWLLPQYRSQSLGMSLEGQRLYMQCSVCFYVYLCMCGCGCVTVYSNYDCIVCVHTWGGGRIGSSSCLLFLPSVRYFVLYTGMKCVILKKQ